MKLKCNNLFNLNNIFIFIMSINMIDKLLIINKNKNNCTIIELSIN